jgi:membrane AbrB-like protein
VKGRRRLQGIALTVAVGAAGGSVFFLLHLPLAWMLGAMCATTFAALAGAPLRMPRPVRATMIAVLGTLLGSSFTPHVLDKLVHWAAAATAILGYVVLATTLVTLYFHRLGGFDRVTAFFSATPGGLGEMSLVGEASGGDPRQIALSHATRILILVFVLPFYLRDVVGLPIGTSVGPIGNRPVASLVELSILALAAGAGFYLARLARIPSAPLLGPLTFSAAIYLLGVVQGGPPWQLVAGAQVVVGAAVGARFVGLDFRVLGRTVLLSVGASAVMLLVAVGYAEAMAPLLGLDHHVLLLALAPGGLAEMALIALSLHYDAAFVSTMHLCRVMSIVLLAPLLFSWLGWKAAGPAD